MYYTLECDHKDWKTVDSDAQSSGDTEESFSELHSIDTPLFEPPSNKKGSNKKKPKKSSNRNSSRELRNLLSDVKMKSWTNSDIDGFEELYDGLDKTMTQIKGKLKKKKKKR